VALTRYRTALAIAILRSGVHECDVEFLIGSWAEQLAKYAGLKFDTWEAAVDKNLGTRFEGGTRVKSRPDWIDRSTYQERLRKGWR